MHGQGLKGTKKINIKIKIIHHLDDKVVDDFLLIISKDYL
jgi:hypothetical protein